jgi:two-component system, sensor histidine kinase LadS
LSLGLIQHAQRLKGRWTGRVGYAACWWAWMVCLAGMTLLGTAQAAAANPTVPVTPQSTSRSIVLSEQVRSLTIDHLTEHWVSEDRFTSIEQVEAWATSGTELFKPRTSGQRHMLGEKVLWIRFEATVVDAKSRWFMRLALPTLDQVTVFWRDENQQWVRREAGDAVPRAQWSVRDRVPTFQLHHEAHRPVTYYLRIEHTRVPFSAPISLLRETELIEQTAIDYGLMGAYFGIALLVSTVSIGMGWRMQDRGFHLYAVFVLSVALWHMAYFGIGAQWLWPQATHWADRLSHVLPQIAAVASLWLLRDTLRIRRLSRQLDTITQVQIVVLLMSAIASSISTLELVSWTSSVCLLITVLLALAMMVRAVPHGDTATRWIALGFSMNALGAVPPLLRNVGLLANGPLSHYSLAAALSIQMPMLLYALVIRSADRREAKARAAGLPTRDVLTGLPNMRALLAQLHTALVRAQRYRQQYGLMLVELSNHSWFVREHGRDVADRALVLTATRLHQAIRDVDMACRLQDNQFVVFIDGPCTPGSMAKSVARVTSSAMGPSEALPVGAQLKLQITCALLPDAQAQDLFDDVNAQIAWLLEQAESDQADARRLVRTINF